MRPPTTGSVASHLSLKLRLRWVVCAIVLAILAAWGCGTGAKPTIFMIPKGSHHIFWQTVRAGADEAGREFGFRVEWLSPASEADTARQIEIVNSLVARRAQAIALAPIDKKALVAAVHNAKAKQIPVALFDSGLESEEYVSYVATDNAGAGRLAARRMGKTLHGSGDVAIISFMPGSDATIEREQAFRDELRLLFPGVQVVAMQYGMADQTRAERIMQEMLDSHSRLAGVFTDNESSSTGALRVLQRRPSSNLKLVAFDSSNELVSGLKSGIVDSLVVQNPYRMGYETIRALAARLAGKHPPVFVDSGVRLVLAGDVDDPEVSKLLFNRLEPGGGHQGR